METTLPALPKRTISLRPDVYDTLLRIAVREGKNVEAVADELLTETLSHNPTPKQVGNDTRPLHEVLAPFQAAFEATSMTDDELGDFLDSEVAAHRREWAETHG